MISSRRLSVVIAALALAEALICVPGCGGTDAGVSTPAPAEYASLGAPIALDGMDADVWTWRKTIAGACHCGEEGAAVWLTVNGVEVPAQRQGDRFSAEVLLGEGENRIVAHCRRPGGQEDRSEPITLTQELRRRPTARIRASLTPEGVLLDSRDSTPCEASAAPITAREWRAAPGNPAPISLRLSAETVLLTPPKVDGEYYVYLKVTDSGGRSDTAGTYFAVREGKPHLVDLQTENPAWVDSAVIYGVVPHNFGPAGFRSVIERLDSLQDLGVTALWLCPITSTQPRSHGYSVYDYFTVRSDYGTEEDFRALVTEAHARGIRILLDFVPNHTAVQHRYMQHALEHGCASPYFDFYDRDPATGNYTYYFNWRRLPNLNYENPEVRRWMMEAFSYWVREFDVDGFRVDACWGVKERRPDFWPEWREEMKRIKPDLLLLAEATAREDWWFENGYDAAYDWTDDLGKWAWEFVFDDPDQIVGRLHAALTNEGRGFHEEALIFRFLNNNDTGERFITRHGRAMELVAAAMLLTLPGLPSVYTGQEVGAEFHPYGTSQPISWEDRHGLRDEYRTLVRLRRSHPSLHSRQWEILKVDSDRQLFVYCRYGRPGDAPALVVLNFSPNAATVEIPLTERSRSFALTGELTNLVTGGSVLVARPGPSTIRVALPGLSARILAPKG